MPRPKTKTLYYLYNKSLDQPVTDAFDSPHRPIEAGLAILRSRRYNCMVDGENVREQGSHDLFSVSHNWSDGFIVENLHSGKVYDSHHLELEIRTIRYQVGTDELADE